jgi:hypothetical protein
MIGHRNFLEFYQTAPAGSKLFAEGPQQCPMRGERLLEKARACVLASEDRK